MPHPPVPKALALGAVLAFAALDLSSCQEGLAFGMRLSRLDAILEWNDPAPLLALSDEEACDPGELGPDSFYFIGRWLQSRASEGDERARSRIENLFRLGFEKSRGVVRLESARALSRLFARGSRWGELLALESASREAFGPDWIVGRTALEAFEGLLRYDDLFASIVDLRSAFPVEAAGDDAALAYFEAAALLGADDPRAAVALTRILVEQPLSAWTARASRLAAAPNLAVPEAIRAAGRARSLVYARDYGPAYREAMAAQESLLSPDIAPELVSDLCKAYLYSGNSGEGIDFAFRVEAIAASPESARTALFYRGRFSRALELWDEAAHLFASAAAAADTDADADAALWYGADCAIKSAKAAATSSAAAAAAAAAAARRAALDAIVAASASWKDPGDFVDLSEALFLEAMTARDWFLIDAMADRLEGSLPVDTWTRIAYVRARAFELGYYPATRSGSGSDPDAPRSLGLRARADRAETMFRSIAEDIEAPLHYRALSSWRAGMSLPLVAPEIPSPAPPERPDPEEAFLALFPRYGLADAGVAEARARTASLDDEELRRLAAAFAAEGRHDSSIRLAAILAARPDREPRRSDFELLYPRPYLSEYRAISPRPKLPEAVFFGLLRSESLFRSDALSSAGAVGAAQLMPATAAEVARSLGIESYDLTSVSDNLRLGAALFADLLAQTGRPLRAMWAYNAGRSRLRKWLAESADLPDDLLIEALGLEETRQYGRNIVSAASIYGELYYGLDAALTAGYIVTGEPGE
ncbi:MAG: lytic transglycosylase domain-containing protein [Spirochaetaceae bacterium]|nr:lytic transglycosylase domain-containing protein [Spirochaetaceae bacterium]